MSTSSKNLHPVGFSPARATGDPVRQPLYSLSQSQAISFLGNPTGFLL